MPGEEVEAITLCPYIYKDAFCRYAGDVPSCDKTFKDCRSHGNVERFGGMQSQKGWK